jgi:hemerythrin-like domain-containing protein
VVDFIRTYADKTHHGKEEDVLFRDLKKKELKPDDAATMEELIQEHVFGRRITRELLEANEAYKYGDRGNLQTVLEKLRTLTEFYPEHIDKEDRVFFPAVLAYLSDEEQQAMLREFEEVDRRMIHEKYTALVASYEKG